MKRQQSEMEIESMLNADMPIEVIREKVTEKYHCEFQGFGYFDTFQLFRQFSVISTVFSYFDSFQLFRQFSVISTVFSYFDSFQLF